VQIYGVLPCLSFKLLATPQGACSAQKRHANDSSKSLYIFQTHEDARGRTWTASDEFPAPFAVEKQYQLQGTQSLTPISKFGTMMTGPGIFLRK